jgi:hypothetical protein
MCEETQHQLSTSVTRMPSLTDTYQRQQRAQTMRVTPIGGITQAQLASVTSGLVTETRLASATSGLATQMSSLGNVVGDLRNFENTAASELLRLQGEIDLLTSSAQGTEADVASVRESHERNLLDQPSLFIPKPFIYTLAKSDTVTIGTTMNPSTAMIFRRTNTVVHADSGYSGHLPEGVYTVKIQMNGNSSSQDGLYLFHGTAPFVVSHSTNDPENLPAIELPLSYFHHASRHGQCRLFFIPRAGGWWHAYLVWDTVDPSKTADTFNCTVKFKREYWG